VDTTCIRATCIRRKYGIRLCAVVTDADGNHAIIRICDSVILSVCLSVCVCVHTIKPKLLKPKLPKGQRSRSQGHKVHNVATRQPCCTVSLRLCRRATRRSRTAVSSRDDTTVQDCLIEGDRVVGVSYALYRVPSL